MSASMPPRQGANVSRALIGGLFASLLVGLPGTAPSSAAPVAAPTAAAQELKPTPAARSRFGKLRLGVSPGFSIQDTTDAQLRSDLTRSKKLGVKQIRIDISWEQIQPERDVISWEKTDRVLAAAKNRKLKVLAVVGFAPEWSRAADGQVVPARFRNFVDAVAKRYRYKVANWEIWNEPNQIHRWNANPNPATYARVVEAASSRIRRHDPKAKILMGGLAPGTDERDGSELSPISFLKGVYRAGIDRSSYDAVSIHPFSFPAFPSGDEEWNTFNRLPDIYAVVRNNGDGGKPMWLTEYGARTGTTSRSVSYKRHAKLVVDAYRETKKLPFVQALYFFSIRDFSNDRRESEANFGLLKFDGTPKPAYKKLRRELRRN